VIKMSDPAGSSSTIDGFLAQLRGIPWFANLGRPSPEDSAVGRIDRWEDWPGPEEPSVAALHERQQEMYDSIMREPEIPRDDLRALWDRIHAVVFESATPRVPYDPDQDSWHGPSAAVWHAAWTAGLVGLYLRSGRPIPPDLQEQWSWFVRGHWPCGSASVVPNERIVPLLVY
jgi:hypothetical protein